MKSLRILTGFIVLFSVFTNVSAVPVTTSFDTTVQFTSGIPGVNVGESFSASYTWENDEAAASYISSPFCDFSGCIGIGLSFTSYRFTNPAYSGHVATQGLNYSSDSGVTVTVYNNYISFGIITPGYGQGILGNSGIYDFITISGTWGSLGTDYYFLIGEESNIPEIYFGLSFIGNSELFTDTTLPFSIDNLIASPNYIGAGLRLSQREMQNFSSPCLNSVTIIAPCLGFPGGYPVTSTVKKLQAMYPHLQRCC